MDKCLELAGIELTEEQVEQITRASAQWGQKEFIDNHNTTTDIRPERKDWWIPRKIIRDHQVFDRRPRVVYIRGEI